MGAGAAVVATQQAASTNAILGAMAVSQVISGIGSAYGQYQAGRAEASAIRFNASMAKIEAAILKTRLPLIEAKREFEVKRVRRERRRMTSRQIAAFSKAGVLLQGSPLSVIEDSVAESELDIISINFNANVAKMDISTDISKLGIEAGFLQRQASIAERSGFFKAGTTLLTGISRAASTFALRDVFKSGVSRGGADFIPSRGGSSVIL